MKYTDIKKLENKKVVIKNIDGFFTTTTLPPIIDSDIISIKDKFGKEEVLNVSEIVSIREV